MSDTIRKVGFESDGPVEVSVAITAGSVEVRLREESGVDVEIRPAPGEANPWAEGITTLMSWVGSQLGEQGPVDPAAEAVAQARVDFGAAALSVRSAKGKHLNASPIGVVVHAPVGSSVITRTGTAGVSVTGRADRVEIGTGGGEISVEEATGAVRATTGTGAIRLGPTPTGGHVRSGSGDIEAAALGGPSTVVTSGGEIRLGTVSGDVQIRTGTGDITVTNAESGHLELTTGSGNLRVAVAGPAEFDLTSTSGTARSEIPVTQKRPEATPSLRVTGRTGSGSVLVHKSGS